MQRDEVHAFPTLLVQAFARNRSLSLGPVQELSGCEHIGVVRGKNSIASKDGSANIKFSGRDTQILAALDHINGMNYTNAVMTLAKKELGLLIGKGGATIKEVEERNGVDIEIAKSESENVTIVGKVDDVQKCTNEIELLLSENEEVEEAVDFTSAHRNLMLDNNAAKVSRERARANGCTDQNALIEVQNSAALVHTANYVLCQRCVCVWPIAPCSFVHACAYPLCSHMCMARMAPLFTHVYGVDPAGSEGDQDLLQLQQGHW